MRKRSQSCSPVRTARRWNWGWVKKQAEGRKQIKRRKTVPLVQSGIQCQLWTEKFTEWSEQLRLPVSWLWRRGKGMLPVPRHPTNTNSSLGACEELLVPKKNFHQVPFYSTKEWLSPRPWKGWWAAVTWAVPWRRWCVQPKVVRFCFVTSEVREKGFLL